MELPEQDHYEIARDKALGELRENTDPGRLRSLGVRLEDGGDTLVLPCLKWKLRIGLEPYRMTVLPPEAGVKIAWQILALNYLSMADPVPPTGFEAFADFPEGRSYESAFHGRVCQRMSRGVGRERGRFLDAARQVGATPTEGEPIRCIFRFFPLFELQVVRYEGDEDFDPSCTVLLPDNTLKVFSMEDAVVAAEKLVSALNGRSPAESGEERTE